MTLMVHYLKELIPFAFDPAGNLICFDYKNHEENQLLFLGT